eukprot:907864_1
MALLLLWLSGRKKFPAYQPPDPQKCNRRKLFLVSPLTSNIATIIEGMDRATSSSSAQISFTNSVPSSTTQSVSVSPDVEIMKSHTLGSQFQRNASRNDDSLNRKPAVSGLESNEKILSLPQTRRANGVSSTRRSGTEQNGRDIIPEHMDLRGRKSFQNQKFSHVLHNCYIVFDAFRMSLVEIGR